MGLGPSRYPRKTEYVYIEGKKEYVYVDRPLPNPKPDNFKIIHAKQKGDYLIAIVQYPDCTNFEGTKLMVFCGLTEKELLEAKTLDPHFSDKTSKFSPVARFRPTLSGWDAAELFTDVINDNPHHTRLFPPGLKYG